MKEKLINFTLKIMEWRRKMLEISIGRDKASLKALNDEIDTFKKANFIIDKVKYEK